MAERRVAAGSARYFFSLRHGDRLVQDREGVELPPGSDLETCARFLATRLRNDDGLSDVGLAGSAVEVSDSGGHILLTVSLPSN